MHDKNTRIFVSIFCSFITGLLGAKEGLSPQKVTIQEAHERWEKLHNAGVAANVKLDTQNAIKNLEKALHVSKDYDGERVPWPKTALALIDIYKAQNNAAAEARTWLSLIEAFQAHGKKFLEQVAVIHGKVALLYRAIGKLDLAVEHSKKGFETFSQIQPPKPYELLLMKAMYGMALQSRGRLRAASETLERVLPKIKANPAGREMETRIKMILGIIYFHWRKNDRAETRLESAAKELDWSLTGAAVEGIGGLTCLAKIKMLQKKHTEAEKLILRIQELIKDNPYVSKNLKASILRDTALLYVIKKDLPKARARLKEAQNLISKKDSLSILVAANLKIVQAQIDFETANKVNALAKLDRALGIQLEKLPDDHPAVIETIETKIYMLNALGRRKEASAANSKLEILRKGFEK